MFDHGIFQRILGLELSDYLFADTFSAINKGNVAEQFTGTEILKYHDPQSRQDLLYWQREKCKAFGSFYMRNTLNPE